MMIVCIFMIKVLHGYVCCRGCRQYFYPQCDVSQGEDAAVFQRYLLLTGLQPAPIEEGAIGGVLVCYDNCATFCELKNNVFSGDARLRQHNIAAGDISPYGDAPPRSHVDHGQAAIPWGAIEQQPH